MIKVENGKVEIEGDYKTMICEAGVAISQIANIIGTLEHIPLVQAYDITFHLCYHAGFGQYTGKISSAIEGFKRFLKEGEIDDKS